MHVQFTDMLTISLFLVLQFFESRRQFFVEFNKFQPDYIVRYDKESKD